MKLTNITKLLCILLSFSNLTICVWLTFPPLDGPVWSSDGGANAPNIVNYPPATDQEWLISTITIINAFIFALAAKEL